jgi:hypothetical protein
LRIEFVGIVAAALMAFGCASNPAPPSGIVASKCGESSVVRASDLQTFGFHPSAGKIHVFRIFASWCPFCENDLARMGQQFANGKWSAANVEVLLLAYHNRREDRQSFEKFKNGELKTLGIPSKGLQIQFVDQDYEHLKQSLNSSGHLLFKGWRGIPFGLVFGKDGRLVFRGHFTISDSFEDGHYEMITRLQKESCGPQEVL